MIRLNRRQNAYLDCVSVVVVELWVESDAQPETNAKATTATQERMICFMMMIGIVDWFVD